MQYALQECARHPGWHLEDIKIIDADLVGLTGASAQHRTGFQELVAKVTLGQAGIIASSVTACNAHELRNEMRGILSRVLKAEAYAELDMVAL